MKTTDLMLGAVLLGGLGALSQMAPMGAERRAAAAEATQAEVGKAAPDFTLTDLSGKTFHLADQKGKKVVLEWFNPDCPFVRYAHTKGPLKDMGSRYGKQGVVWVAINSGSPGKQGTGSQRNQDALKEYGISYPVMLDESGKVGHLYGAKSTPQLYVIDEKGVLLYKGALDNAPLGDATGAAPVNYVDAAFEDARAGKPVKTSDTKSYGCSVKYGP